jgi:electron transport complex protein RnfC
MAGVNVHNSGHLSMIDGGPYLHEMGIEELGTGDAYVRRTTNEFLLISKDSEGKEYADVETEPPEEGIVSLVGKVLGVHLPLGGRFLEPAKPLISGGASVEYEQKTGDPVDEGFSIGVWSSMEGTVSSIKDDIVAIAGGAVPQEEAEAETEAEEAR